MAKQETFQKQKKKRWFSVLAPKQFNEILIGESPAEEPETLLGKTVTVSLMNLTRNIKKQNISTKLRVAEVKDNKALTEFYSYDTNYSSIKRIVRRRKNRVDDSFVTKTKDDVKIRVKPMVLTRMNANQSVLRNIRSFAKTFLVKRLSDMTYGEFVDSVVRDRIHKEMKRGLDKIYPTKICFVRAFNKVSGEKIKLVTLTEKDEQIFSDVMNKKDKRDSRHSAPSRSTDNRSQVKTESASEDKKSESSKDEAAKKEESSSSEKSSENKSDDDKKSDN